MKKIFLFSFFLCISIFVSAQDQDSVMIRKFFDISLTSHTGYNTLKILCKEVGGRLAGTENSLKAVKWAQKTMKSMSFDTVYLMPCMVRHWERGKRETAKVLSRRFGGHDLHICALGGSVPTPLQGITAEVIEVDSLSSLSKIGREKIQGKIVFFNRPMDPRPYRTFAGYGGAVDQRGRGAMEAAKFGAAGVLVRSVTLLSNIYPHTGVMRYDTVGNKIPAAGIATLDADSLSAWLKKDNRLSVNFVLNTEILPDVESFNVIGEVRGSLYPDEVILVSGHLDSWDLAEGAQDDGAGCIHALEAVRLLQQAGIKPLHTIRCVFFMDEEMSQRGARKYAEVAKTNHLKHLAAIESDAGGFTPNSFGMDGPQEAVSKFKAFSRYFRPYGLHEFTAGGGGTDVSFLKELKVPLIGLSTESSRYFDFHHCALDILENVNERELQAGCGWMASLIYLLDKYGL